MELAAPAPKPRYRCPSCHGSDLLWEEVELTGWRSIDETLQPSSDVRELGHPWTTGNVGCGACAWEGGRTQLERLGIDGEPLPRIHPEQLMLEVA